MSYVSLSPSLALSLCSKLMFCWFLVLGSEWHTLMDGLHHVRLEIINCFGLFDNFLHLYSFSFGSHYFGFFSVFGNY